MCPSGRIVQQTAREMSAFPSRGPDRPATVNLQVALAYPLGPTLSSLRRRRSLQCRRRALACFLTWVAAIFCHVCPSLVSVSGSASQELASRGPILCAPVLLHIWYPRTSWTVWRRHSRVGSLGHGSLLNVAALGDGVGPFPLAHMCPPLERSTQLEPGDVWGQVESVVAEFSTPCTTPAAFEEHLGCIAQIFGADTIQEVCLRKADRHHGSYSKSERAMCTSLVTLGRGPRTLLSPCGGFGVRRQQAQYKCGARLVSLRLSPCSMFALGDVSGRYRGRTSAVGCRAAPHAAQDGGWLGQPSPCPPRLSAHAGATSLRRRVPSRVR